MSKLMEWRAQLCGAAAVTLAVLGLVAAPMQARAEDLAENDMVAKEKSIWYCHDVESGCAGWCEIDPPSATCRSVLTTTPLPGGGTNTAYGT